MITGQEIFNIVDLFTSQSTINFYENIFDNLDLSFIPEFIESKRGPKGYSRHALTRAFVVMNCEHFREITLLCDFLNTNLKIAQLCGFDITKPLPSYSVYQRFIHDIDNNLLKEIMKSQVNELIKLDAIDNSIVSVDSKKNYTFYWYYKNLIMCDAKSGLPIYEVTLTGEKADVSSLINFLDKINSWFSLKNSKILADKGFDSKANYNYIKDVLHSEAFIAKNKRNSKTVETISCGNPLCEAGLAMHKDGKQYLKGSIKQKFCCPFRTSKDDSKCPCNHPKYNNGHKNRGCIKYKSISTDYRSTVDDTSDYFKLYYSKRTESERYNSRFKNLNLENASVRNISSISNLNTLGHICLLTVAIAAIVNKKEDKICSLSKLKRAS